MGWRFSRNRRPNLKCVVNLSFFSSEEKKWRVFVWILMKNEGKKIEEDKKFHIYMYIYFETLENIFLPFSLVLSFKIQDAKRSLI